MPGGEEAIAYSLIPVGIQEVARVALPVLLLIASGLFPYLIWRRDKLREKAERERAEALEKRRVTLELMQSLTRHPIFIERLSGNYPVDVPAGSRSGSGYCEQYRLARVGPIAFYGIIWYMKLRSGELH